MPLVTIQGEFGPQTMWQNDDGSYWAAPDGAIDSSGVRPDMVTDWQKQGQAKMQQLNSYQGFQQFTPEQVQQFSRLSPQAQAEYIKSISPFDNAGIYNDSMYGGNNMWFGPQAGPQHTDNGGPMSWEAVLSGGGSNPWSEQSNSDAHDMRYGAAIMSLPFVGAGITALTGAGAAAGAGAGAAEGGGAAAGVDASTGLYAGESATSGAAGAEGAFGGGSGSASLVGDAGSDTAAAETGFDPGGEGMYNAPSSDGGAFDMGGSQGVFDSSGNGLYSSPTTLSSLTQQAKDMAAKLGISPASALGFLKSALTKGAPAVLGAVGASRQADSLSALAKQYMDLGAPSRARYEASFAPGFTMANDPGYQGALDQAAKATLHGLSVNGNPAGSPNAWGRSMQDLYEKTAYPALQNFRNTNANAGGIASLQTAAPGAATAAIGAQGNIFNAIGAGANDIFNPQPSLAQTLAEYQRLVKAQGSGTVQ